MKLTDYSYFHQSIENYDYCEFETLKNTQQLIKKSYQQNRPVRVRGNGHSMNGSSLPRQNELLLLSASCSHFRFDKPGTITVGSGAAIWDVNQLLQKYGFELYVFNDGNAKASSVGGYLSAGGFGERSILYGGFWETADHIILVNGKGEIIKSVYGDGIFQWLFGSMGQLGFIYEVCLKIKPLSNHPDYPMNNSGRVVPSTSNWPKQVWYNLLTTKKHQQEAIHELNILRHIHKYTWVNRPVYNYEIAFKTFNPPLFFPEQEPILVFGIWGDPWNGESFEPETLRLLEKDFSALIFEKPWFRRYIQAEFVFDDFNYKRYFGQNILAEFKKIKILLDPRNIFGNGILNEK